MKNDRVLDEKTVCFEYVNGKEGVETLASKYHVGKKRIKEILRSNGVEMKKRGAQSDNNEYIIENPLEKKYVNPDGFHYIVKDLKTGFESKDLYNMGGCLTTYIKKQYGVEIPTLYDRRKFYMLTGNYWWEQYLVYELVENNKVKKCPYCDWVTNDTRNKSGAFEQHLMKVHKIDKMTYIKEHPEDKSYFSLVSPILNLQMNDNESDYVTCKICGKKLTKIGNSHLKTHSITKEQYVEKYGRDEIMSETTHKKFVDIARRANMNLSEKGKDRFTSKAETEIMEYLSERGINTCKDRKILYGKELDIYIPERGVAIEYNGNIWHTEAFGGKDRNYHLNKLKMCNEQGVKLIQICDDEYIEHKDIVLNKILHIVGVDSGKPKVYGRKTEVRPIYKYQADEFLGKYHIQGACRATIYYGCFYEGKLIGVMAFKNGSVKNKGWELSRFATDYNYVCCGVGGKMFAQFLKDYDPDEVFSFADRRWTVSSDNNIYTKMGFVLEETLRPDYKYYLSVGNNNRRIHKMSLSKKKMAKVYGLNPRMTESEMARELGYDRIWDCGLFKYVWKKNKSE